MCDVNLYKFPITSSQSINRVLIEILDSRYGDGGEILLHRMREMFCKACMSSSDSGEKQQQQQFFAGEEPPLSQNKNSH